MREIYRTAGTVSFLKWNRATVVSDSGKRTDYRIISQPVEERLSGQTGKKKRLNLQNLHRKILVLYWHGVSKICLEGAGEVVRWLRTLAALPGDPG